MTVEGAAALSVASFIKREEQYSEQNVVLIISGAKISLDVMKKVFCK
jgi:threonine dehydratase